MEQFDKMVHLSVPSSPDIWGNTEGILIPDKSGVQMVLLCVRSSNVWFLNGHPNYRQFGMITCVYFKHQNLNGICLTMPLKKSKRILLFGCQMVYFSNII